jgi:hypothetical protein
MPWFGGTERPINIQPRDMQPCLGSGYVSPAREDIYIRILRAYFVAVSMPSCGLRNHMQFRIASGNQR